MQGQGLFISDTFLLRKAVANGKKWAQIIKQKLWHRPL